MGSKDYSPLYPIFIFNALYCNTRMLCILMATGAPLFLLEFHLGPRVFELCFDFISFFLGHTFLHRFGSFINQRLRFFQAQAGDGTDLFDDSDLFITGEQ
jgi:hypothetical protein